MPAARIQHCVAPRPVDDVRYDGIGHWPVHGKKGALSVLSIGMEPHEVLQMRHDALLHSG